MKRFFRNSNSALFIKECLDTYACASPCNNHVVHKGLAQEVQGFWIGSEKGWGIRTPKDLSMDCFLFEFIGEILTTAKIEKQVVHVLTTYK